MTGIRWDRKAIESILHANETRRMVEKATTKVQTTTRENVQKIYPGTTRTKGIGAESGEDSESVYGIVGYTKDHPGFVLWWTEVGTRKMRPRPHLRAALNQVRL